MNLGSGFDMVPMPLGGDYGEINNLPTLPGQNSRPPSQKLFARHFFLRYTTQANSKIFYDASYGVTYTSPKNFEQTALAGYGDGVALSNGRMIDIVKVPAAGAAARVKFVP